MKKYFILSVCLLLFLAGCSPTVHSEPAKQKKSLNTVVQTSTKPTLQQEEAKYKGQKPTEWGEQVTGVIHRLPTDQKVIALTFDACGGKHGSGYDKDIINYLMLHKIPATLFINSRWINANPTIFTFLAHNPLFEIENHGTEHRPLSVTGRGVYGIRGTRSITEVYQEVNGNEQKITKLTGRAPKFFRSGTAFYDNIAVKIALDLGVKPLNFDVLGDAGATFNTHQVEQAMLTAKPGSIIILHMNQPKGDTAEGMKKAIPLLLKKGYHFVKLEQYLN